MRKFLIVAILTLSLAALFTASTKAQLTSTLTLDSLNTQLQALKTAFNSFKTQSKKFVTYFPISQFQNSQDFPCTIDAYSGAGKISGNDNARESCTAYLDLPVSGRITEVYLIVSEGCSSGRAVLSASGGNPVMPTLDAGNIQLDLRREIRFSSTNGFNRPTRLKFEIPASENETCYFSGSVKVTHDPYLL